MATTSTPRRLLWFIGFWLAGVLTVTALGLVIRLMLAN